MLIKIDTQEYPVSEQDFINRHPNISFPTAIPYDDFGYAVVFPTPQPETDWYHLAREIAPVLTDKQYAGIGYTYDAQADVFITPQPYPSWVLDSNYDWVAPVPYPQDGKCYVWDESIINWVEVPCMPTGSI